MKRVIIAVAVMSIMTGFAATAFADNRGEAFFERLRIQSDQRANEHVKEKTQQDTKKENQGNQSAE